MSDFEQRLRAAVVERSADVEPSPDLPERITDRVRRRDVRRRLRAAGGTVAAAAAIAVVVGLVATGGDDDGSIRMSDDTATTTTTSSTTTSTPSTTTTTPTTTSTTAGPPTSGAPTGGGTTDPPPVSPTGPALDVLTPVNRQGIGPITAGMTVRRAQEVGGVTLVTTGSSGTCVEMQFEGFDPSAELIVETTGGDVLDGIVRAVQGSVASTGEGAIVGQSRAELLAALGSPTRTEAAVGAWSGDGEVLIFESGGFAYGALVVDDMVLGIQSGDPAWVRYTEGCPA